ncbi:hypothetical protein SGPA1_40219 [Streptomyces misionensis JCM 4497]
MMSKAFGRLAGDGLAALTDSLAAGRTGSATQAEFHEHCLMP